MSLLLYAPDEICNLLGLLVIKKPAHNRSEIGSRAAAARRGRTSPWTRVSGQHPGNSDETFDAARIEAGEVLWPSRGLARLVDADVVLQLNGHHGGGRGRVCARLNVCD